MYSLIEQRARVVAIRNGQLHVQSLQRSDCARCAAGQGCGGQLFGRSSQGNATLTLSDIPAMGLQIGDVVVIGVQTSMLQRAALLLYSLPLLVVLISAGVLSRLPINEGWQVLLVTGSLLLSFLWVRRRAQQLTAQPALHLLRKDSAVDCSRNVEVSTSELS